MGWGLHAEGEVAGGDVLAIEVVECRGADVFIHLAFDLRVGMSIYYVFQKGKSEDLHASLLLGTRACSVRAQWRPS